MKLNIKAFTLIELLVIISIISLLMLVVYVPYSHFQKQAKLRIAGREISQSFYDAKNMAVSGIVEFKESEANETENKSIGLFINTEEGKNNALYFYSFPYNVEKQDISLDENKIIKKVQLQDGIYINYLSGYNNLLFFFDSIEGNLEIFNFLNKGGKEIVENKNIEIMFSYENATTPSLQKKLTYFRNTNIIDYE